MEKLYEDLGRRVSALSDPIRLKILDLLVQGRDQFCKSDPHPLYPDALCPHLDMEIKLENISPSKLSYHLKELRQAKLIEEHRQGKCIYYSLNAAALSALLEDVRTHFLSAYQKVDAQP
jgi:ArsR family transcriptional regulator